MKILLVMVVMASACSPIPDPTYKEECPNPVACVCERLCQLDCVECHPNCEPSLERVIASGISHFDVPCVLGASTRQEVRGCPMIECQ